MHHRVLLVIFSAFAVFGCGDNHAPLHTIADHVRADERFSTLEAGLRDAGLLELLDEPGPFTLFAFRDTEFQMDSLGAVQREPFLKYHIHQGELGLEEMEERTSVTTLEGRDVHVRFGLDGLLLDDGVAVVDEPITTENGTILVLDRPFSRTLYTSDESGEHTGGIPLVEGAASDFISFEYSDLLLHDLHVSVTLNVEAASVYYMSLTHVDSDRGISLARGLTLDPGEVTLTFADSAEGDIQLDLAHDPETGGALVAAPSYRPYSPLENLLGEPLGGEWQLRVFAFAAGEPQEPLASIASWSMQATTSAQMPEPAIVLDPRYGAPAVLGAGLREEAAVVARRVGGLQGEMELSGSMGPVVAEPLMLGEEGRSGVLEFAVPADAEPGQVSGLLAARVGDVSRARPIPARIARPQARGISLVAQLPLSVLGAPFGSGADVWGWTDPETGREYALLGTSDGTAFVDISEPSAPVVVGTLPTASDPSTWRDIKAYDSYAFIVSEAREHGLQVFDLRQLRDASPGQVFEATAHVSGLFGGAHNIAINEDSATAYVVGSDLCNGGHVIFDIGDPEHPAAIGCFSGAVSAEQPGGAFFPTDVYTHDTQCVTYSGPDADYQGREVCISSDEETVGIADLTNPESPKQIARVSYNTVGYAHQGWFTDDQAYFLSNDEFDESYLQGNTRTYVWDMHDLDNPFLAQVFENPSQATGHNLYVVGDEMFQANYASGLRVVKLGDLSQEGSSEEIAYYDTYLDDDECSQNLSCAPWVFEGAWSVYPFFESGTVVVSDIQRGLFVLKRE
jgi:choice-of-anchor B domain-containing protein